MEEEGVLESERSGRNKNYSLTQAGRKIADGLADTFDFEVNDPDLERDL